MQKRVIVLVHCTSPNRVLSTNEVIVFVLCSGQNYDGRTDRKDGESGGYICSPVGEHDKLSNLCL